MKYWQGCMNWFLDKDWVCETCGERVGLTWGMTHAECRCDKCHTIYTMRNWEEDGDPIVSVPICRLKYEYREPAKAGWELWHTPILEWNDAKWEEAFKAAYPVTECDGN